MEESLIMAVIIIVIFIVLQFIGRKMTLKKMTLLLDEERYDEFFKVTKGMICYLTIKPYTKENMKLSAYIAQDKKDEVKKEIDLIENMRIQPQQKIISISNAFYYFLEKNEGKLCKDMLNYVKKIGDEKSYKNLDIQYSIFILKESKYIDEVKRKLDLTRKNNQILNKDLMMGSLEYLLGLQYSYLNDTKNMMKYFKPALEHCKGTSYELEIKKIIEKNQK